MQQVKPQNIALSNNSLLESGVIKNNDYSLNLPQPYPPKQKQSLIDKSLKNAQKSLRQKKFLRAKNQFIQVFEQKKSIEIALLISECFVGLRSFKDAIVFFEKNLPYFKNNGKYWGILALHNYAAEDHEGAAGAAYKAINEHELMFLDLWKIFVQASKKLKRTDVLYEVCEKQLSKLNSKAFSKIIQNPHLVDGYLTACSAQDPLEGWNFVNECGITISNVDKFGELSGVISASIASLVPEDEQKYKLELLWNTKAIELAPENAYIRWNLSHSQLREGIIAEGIKNYECRFLWEDFPSFIREFKKPRWHPNVSTKSKILIWFEQGVGDQIKYFSAINIFKQKFPNLIIETSEKTYPIIRAAFDDVEVRISTMEKDLTTKEEDFDYHVPSASMFFHVVGENATKIQKEEFYLLDQYLKLGHLSKKPKIGICWTSENNSDRRVRHYTSIGKWQKLLEMPEFSFVSLQYHLDMEEIYALGKISENFLDTGFLDQKEDLEGAIALISNLDFVISTSSAPAVLSSALGIPTLIYSAHSLLWLGRKNKFQQHPIFKNTLIYPTPKAEQDEDLVTDVQNFLKNKF